MLVRFTIVGAALVALACLTPRGFAQTNAGPPQHSSASRSEEAPPSPIGDSDQTLEIAPRAAPPVTISPPEPENGSGSAAASPASIPASDNGSAAANQKRPYIGASVQYIYSDDTAGRDGRPYHRDRRPARQKR